MAKNGAHLHLPAWPLPSRTASCDPALKQTSSVITLADLHKTRHHLRTTLCRTSTGDSASLMSFPHLPPYNIDNRRFHNKKHPLCKIQYLLLSWGNRLSYYLLLLLPKLSQTIPRITVHVGVNETRRGKSEHTKKDFLLFFDVLKNTDKSIYTSDPLPSRNPRAERLSRIFAFHPWLQNMAGKYNFTFVDHFLLFFCIESTTTLYK